MAANIVLADKSLVLDFSLSNQNYHAREHALDLTDYSGIDKIRIPCDLIWLPDIVLYNKYVNDPKG